MSRVTSGSNLYFITASVLEENIPRYNYEAPLIFSVSKSSLPVRVVWWNHGQQIAVGDKYSVVETAEGGYSVIINPVELSDDGEWRVNVENQFGSASSECTLTLRVPKNYRKPRFVENLKAVLTKEGLVSFECKVVGFPTPLLR